MKSLHDEVRSEQNIFAAWRHVKRSALISADTVIRGQASEFEHEHQRHLRRIIKQLREARLDFDKVEGVLKDVRKRTAKGKDPRPIAIATLKNRVVQRAILQVLQPRVLRDGRDLTSRAISKRDPRLGRINDVNQSKYGVGGLIHPYGGVRPAIESIMAAIDGGAKYFYKSDIKDFFTHIRTGNVVNFIRCETHDDAFADLFEKALEVHLRNPDELKGYASLFPKGGIGVAQGSSLSAFAGNALLFELDYELNGMGVTCIRYIDDILMVARTENDLDRAARYAEETLSKLGFGLYTPGVDADKAARGECANSIDFLGCTIQPRRCVPSAQSLKNMRKSVSDALSESKSAIKEAVRKGEGFNPKFSTSATLHSLGNQIYGWQKAFAFCNQPQPFLQFDDYVAKQVMNYRVIVERFLKGTGAQLQMQVLGIPSTYQMFVDGRRKSP